MHDHNSTYVYPYPPVIQISEHMHSVTSLHSTALKKKVFTAQAW
uniref:Uncharacterized protein n=1 Tax=Arundo donax TaxID=35708 RepID=A0A0A9F589_ARUDO